MWDLAPEQFIIVTKLPLRSMGKHDAALRYYNRDSQHKITFAKKMLPEVIFNFKMRKMQSVAVSIFNRNENGKIDEKEFAALADSIKKYAAAATNDKKPLSESRKFSKFHIDAVTYRSKSNDFIICMSSRGRIPDYIKLMIYPPNKAPSLHELIRSDAKGKELELNLILEKNGDSYLDIPLSTQKSSGFFVASSIDRMMKYYGLPVPAKVLAEFTKQDSAKTAETDDLVKIISSNDSKLKLRIRKLIHDTVFEKTNTIDRFNGLYNNCAKKAKRPRINIRDYSEGKGRNRKINTDELIGAYEYPVFKAARCRNGRMPEKFLRTVQEHLNKGTPLLWITYEFANSAKGKKIGKFSMQLNIINGFNEDKQSIIYIDGKGKGNGQKNISAEDAWARTAVLFAATPR